MAGPRYVQSAGHHLAYQVLDGSSAHEVVLTTPGGTIPIDFLTRDRIGARLVDGLCSIGRLVLFDRRGIGQSDPVLDWTQPLIAQWAEDLAAVVTGVCVRPPVVVSLGDYWGPARLFAAEHTDDLDALVLYEPTGPDADRLTDRVDTSADGPMEVDDGTSPDRPRREPPDTTDADADWILRVCPSRAGDTTFREWFDLAGRAGAGPAVAARIYQRPPVEWVQRLVDAQGAIDVPTLVLRRPGSSMGTPPGPDSVAAAIPGARRADLPGTDYHWLGEEVDALVAEISHFVTGEHHVPRADRFVTAVLFTDLVDSTGRAVAHGDARWRVLLDRHDAMMHEIVGRVGGSVVKSTGDGVLAILPSGQAALDAADATCLRLGGEGLPVRVGIHVGDIERRGSDVSGVGVHIAARVMAAAGAGEILVTESLALAVQGSPWTFTHRADVDLRGVPGTWRLLVPRRAVP